MSRLEQLEQFRREDPNDPFNIYALALEYDKIDPSKATELFNLLLTDHSEYVPTYYHAAIHFESLGDTARAIAILEKGVELAGLKNEQKARRELQSLLGELQ